MSCSELQSEELEVLKSIYEGDDAYAAVSASQHQYKFGEDGASRSFVLDLTWGDDYPEQLPAVSMDAFYNKHVVDEVKTKVVEAVKEEAEQYLGMSMTYSLFEFVKERADELMEGQPEQFVEAAAAAIKTVSIADDEVKVSNKPKKEQLTKSQKRRMWDKGGLDTEERPRGWNWIDVIRHLSQTGAKPEGS